MKHHTCLLLAFVLLSGCAAPPRFDWPKPSPLAHEMSSYIPPPKPVPKAEEATVFSEPATLALRDAMAAALMHNPQLRSFAWELRTAEARTLQASLPPNPEAALEVENFSGSGETSGFDGAETTLSISQIFLLGGKRKTRGHLASLDRELAAFDYETTRVGVLSDVATRFVQLLRAQRSITLTERAHELAQQVFDVVTKKVDAGVLSPVEKSRSRLTVSTARLAAMQSKRTLKTSRIHLAALWGTTRPEFDTATGNLEQVPETIPAVEAIAELINDNPDVARWAAEISKRETALVAACADAIPDLGVEGGIRHFNNVNDVAFVVGLSLPLPLFDRNQGGRREARRSINKAREERHDAHIRVGAALATGYEALSASHTTAVTLRDDILPTARSAYEATETAFEQGKVGYLDILETQRTLIQLETEYLDALTTFHIAVIEVERLIAQPLDNVSLSQPRGALP